MLASELMKHDSDKGTEAPFLLDAFICDNIDESYFEENTVLGKLFLE